MSQDFFSARQFRTLAALCDTLIPALPRAADPYGFWARAASDLGIPAEIAAITRDLTDEIAQRDTRRLLNLLSNPLAAGLLTGQFRPFVDLPLERRERILRGWADSPAGLLRQAFQGLKRATGALFFSKPADDGRNPNWPAIGYPGPPGPGPTRPKTIPLLRPQAGQKLDCDVVVAGSGAGGAWPRPSWRKPAET